MSTIIRQALTGAGAISTLAVGGFAYWVNEKTQGLPPSEKGSLLTRMKEVAGSFQQSKKMENGHAARHHVDLVASLSSREYTKENGKAKEEISQQKMNYYRGYLFEALGKMPTAELPIVRYHLGFPSFPPEKAKKMTRGFVLSGAAPHIFDQEAREYILKGEYVRCFSALDGLDGKHMGGQMKRVDVLIAGTTLFRKCEDFEKEVIAGIAYKASTHPQALDPNTCYSDTRVIMPSGEKSDLIHMNEEARAEISKGNYTICYRFGWGKPRLSEECDKTIHAIVVGVENDENACKEEHRKEYKRLSITPPGAW